MAGLDYYLLGSLVLLKMTLLKVVDDDEVDVGNVIRKVIYIVEKHQKLFWNYSDVPYDAFSHHLFGSRVYLILQSD